MKYDSLKKKNLGQFFTTNVNYIFEGFSAFVKNKEVVDPFAGNQDLLNWAKKNGAKSIKGFDFDKSLVDEKIVFYNDSLNNPKKYKFVITNPPYLHKNKADNKTKNNCFSGENSSFEDLYQISLKSIMNSEEGIVIVPLNFLSAENSKKIRELFFNKFEIKKLNIFTEQVFDDTTYNVIAFYYTLKKDIFKNIMLVDSVIFPNNEKVKFELRETFGWQIGGEFISKINSVQDVLGIYRLTTKNLIEGTEKIRLAFNNIKDTSEENLDLELKKAIESNILFLRAIDSRNGKKIQLEDIRDYNVYGLVGKESSRNMAHLMFKKPLSLPEQKELIELFNKELQEAREKHLSLFLTNFRDNNRKRISFEFAYKLLNYIYLNKMNKKQRLLIFN